MKKSRLIHIFRTFNKKEIRLLRKWVESPAHNQRKDVLMLFEYLVTNEHFLSDKHIEKEKVFGKVYSRETYDDAKMRQVIFFLLKVVEEYLIYQEALSSEVRTKLSLAKAYRKRGLGKAFEKTTTISKKLNYNQSYRNEIFHQNQFDIEQEQYLFLEKQAKRNIPMNLQEVSDALDISYLAGKLRQCCLMIAHQKVYKAGYKMGMMEEVLSYVEKNKLVDDVPAIAIYYYIFNLSRQQDSFQKLKKEIQLNSALFPSAEIRDIYLMAINFCIGKMNLGERDYIREAFEMYKLGFEKKILIEKENLTRWTFLNVIMIAVRLKEYVWAENFIESHQKYVLEKYREGFVNYTLAILNYEYKNYSKAIDFLNRSEYDDIVISLTAKGVLMKIYYEQDELDLLDALLESTRTYMQRKKVMGYHKTAFKNLISYARKLVKVNPYDKEEIHILKKEVESVHPLSEKPWLLAQLDKM